MSMKKRRAQKPFLRTIRTREHMSLTGNSQGDTVAGGVGVLPQRAHYVWERQVVPYVRRG